MALNNRHDLFTLDTSVASAIGRMVTITCTCGATSPAVTLEHAVHWFGVHCYQAALDRTVEIIRA